MPLSARPKDNSEAPVHGAPCSIGLVYKAVADDPVELAELNAILYEEGKTQRQVYDVLTEDGGFKVGSSTINKHRGRDCRCFKYPPFRFCAECKRDLPSCVCP